MHTYRFTCIQAKVSIDTHTLCFIYTPHIHTPSQQNRVYSNARDLYLCKIDLCSYTWDLYSYIWDLYSYKTIRIQGPENHKKQNNARKISRYFWAADLSPKYLRTKLGIHWMRQRTRTSTLLSPWKDLTFSRTLDSQKKSCRNSQSDVLQKWRQSFKSWFLKDVTSGIQEKSSLDFSWLLLRKVKSFHREALPK